MSNLRDTSRLKPNPDIVVPRSRLMRTTISKISRVSSGDSPRLGSSSRIICGAAISAREIDSICCCPPESKPASCVARSFRIGK